VVAGNTNKTTEDLLMRNGFKGNLFALAFLALLAIPGGCLASVEDRINEAVPLPKSLEYAKGELLRLAADSGDRGPVELQINAKLRVRALEMRARICARAIYFKRGDSCAFRGQRLLRAQR
jgi:hypothetical protein